MAEGDVPSALSFMGVTGSTPFDAPAGPTASPSPQKASRKRRRMASPEEVAAALPELQNRCSRIVFDDRRGEEGTNLLSLLQVYQHWYEECVPGPAAASLDERILHVENVGGSHSVRNTLMQLGGRAVARQRKQSNLTGSEAAVAATRAEVVDEAEKSRSALFFGGVFEAAGAPTAAAAPATLDEATMKKIEENRKAAMEKRRAREEARRKEEALIAEAESMEASAFDDVDIEEAAMAAPDLDELDREMAEKAARFEAMERAETLEREERLRKEEDALKQKTDTESGAEAEAEVEKAGEGEAKEVTEFSGGGQASTSRRSRSQRALSPVRRSKSPAGAGKRARTSQAGQGSPKRAKPASDGEEDEE